jgi:hypothetical protein
LHPKGKAGVSISKEKYDLIRAAILESLSLYCELTFSELRDQVSEKLKDTFVGSISWYYTTVKLDVEARGEIVRIDYSSPQKIKLV